MSPAGFIQIAILGFEFISQGGDLFFDFVERSFLLVELLLCLPARFGTAKPRAHDFCALLRQSRAPGAQSRGLLVKFRRRRNLGLDLRDLSQEFLVGDVIVLQAPLHPCELAIAKLCRRLGLIALLQDGLLFVFEFA